MSDGRRWILSDDEFHILEKYEKPDVIAEGDHQIVYDLVLLQFMALGFEEEANFQLAETVRLTRLGMKTLVFEREERSAAPASLRSHKNLFQRMYSVIN